MALVFLDGFDHYATAQLQAKWPSGGTTIATNIYSIRQAGGREAGGGALAVSGGGGWSAPYVTLPANGTYTFGMAVNWSTLGGNALGLFCSSNTNQLLVGINGSGYVYAAVKAGTYTATTPVLAANTWYYIEGQIVVSATAGSVTVRVNGTTVISETGINTDAAGSGVCNQFTVSATQIPNGAANVGVNGLYDDLYIFDGAGSANTTFPSAIPTVQCLWPNAPGTNAQWTGLPYASGNNFANVNDETPDGDFTVNQSGTAAQIDTFKHDELRPPTGTVFALQHCITARTATSTAHSVAAAEYTGGTAYVDTGQALSTGYSCLTFPHDTDPATGAAYTVADVNADEYGYELIS